MSKNQGRNLRLSWPHVLTSSYIKVLYLLKFTPELIDWLFVDKWTSDTNKVGEVYNRYSVTM